MDSNVLAEQRREMVINLLKGMKIKKSDGEGFDKDDVYVCMQRLCDVYEKSIEDLTANYDAEIAEMQDKYQKYDENNDLYISLIMEAKKSSNEIITKAKSEVDEILASGKEQIALQEEEIEKAREAAQQEKAKLSAETEQARTDAEAERKALAEEIQEERDKAQKAKQQFRNRIAAMETEFEEIKTNILRTAGRMDGLKSQLEDQDLPGSWDLNEESAAVNVPEPDIAVEETIEDIPSVEVAPAAGETEIVEAAEEELTFEDLVAKLQSEEPATNVVSEPEVELPLETVEAAPQAEAGVSLPKEEELSDLEDLISEDLEIELPLENLETKPEAAPLGDEEISFEGLEELFKEE